MSGYYKKEHEIFCIDCGNKRTVRGPNYGQVKRCEVCQYKRKRVYNSEYMRRRRARNRDNKTNVQAQ